MKSVIRHNSQWQQQEIEQFLDQCAVPMRLACQDDNGFPLLCSLWFLYRDGALLCATHEKSKVARLLLADSRCAFEIAVNNTPYKGVRGQGKASLKRAGAEALLSDLTSRYLDNPRSKLAQWLLKRSAEEYVIQIEIDWISAWDYSSRMQDA